VLGYATRKLLISIVVLFFATLVAFLLVATVDPIAEQRVFLLSQPGGTEQVERLEASLGLDKPLVERYGLWLGDLATGDMGTSTDNGRPVTTLLGEAIPVTLRLVIAATVVSVIIGVAVGVVSEALRLTAAYTSEREQFGRPIATFQAVGQRVGDAYIDTEAIRLTALQACWRLDQGLEASTEVAVAKYWAADGGQRVASRPMTGSTRQVPMSGCRSNSSAIRSGDAPYDRRWTSSSSGWANGSRKAGLAVAASAPRVVPW